MTNENSNFIDVLYGIWLQDLDTISSEGIKTK